jgi:hypothetical protein
MHLPSSQRLPAFCFWFACVALPQELAAQATESAETVGAGQAMIEMDGLSFAHDHDRRTGERMENWNVASTILSFGLRDHLDAQIQFDVFNHERIEAAGLRESHSGHGDVSLRAKWAAWRDERWGGLSLIPYVKLPTKNPNGNNHVEGGLILPWASSRREGWIPGAMIQADVIRDDPGEGYTSQWLASGFVEHALGRSWTFYGEALVETERGWRNASFTVGAGVRWAWSERIELDCETLRGASRRATDWTQVLRLTATW